MERSPWTIHFTGPIRRGSRRRTIRTTPPGRGRPGRGAHVVLLEEPGRLPSAQDQPRGPVGEPLAHEVTVLRSSACSMDVGSVAGLELRDDVPHRRDVDGEADVVGARDAGGVDTDDL